MKQRLLHLTKLFLGWPITFIAFFFIYKIISEKTEVLSFSFSDINFILLITGVFFFLIYFFLRVVLWQKIMSAKNHHLSFISTAFYWSSSEIKRFVPGNIWSTFSRMQQFSEKQIGKPRFDRGKKEIFWAIVEESKIVVLSSLTVSIFSFSFVFSILFPSVSTTIIVSAAWTTVVTLVGIYLYLNPKNYQLLLYGMTSFFFFSLGTYFSISSVTALSPYYLGTFISFFSFCYLIGYLSFVVPMGLGVRETAITIGLSRFIGETTSAIAAIFTRLVLIFSELLFFSLAFFLYKTKETSSKVILTFVQKNWHIVLLGLGIFFYILYFSSASIARYDNYYTGRFDLGNMDQTVWNTTQGRIFQLTDPNGTEIISRLAFHADFFLILLAPLYKVWPDPKLILLVQSVVLGFGALFVYLIAKKILGNKTISLIFAASYLINPGVNYSNLYDFHSVTLATTFLLGAFYFMLQKQYIWFVIFSILSGSTKENIWLILSFFGIYTLLREKISVKKILALIFSLVCIGIFYYLVWIAIPAARGGNHFALSYYSDFGDNPTSIVKNALFSPQKILFSVIQPDRIVYIFQLFFPLGFLSLGSPLLLIFSAPDFFITLMSNNTQLRQIYYHYTAAITPFIFISAIYGAKNIIEYFPKYSSVTICYLLFATCYSVYAYGPLPGAKNPSTLMFTDRLQNKEIIDQFISKIHKNYSVAATNNVGSHLSHRQRIYTIPQGLDKADIIVFLLNDPSAQPSLATQIQMADNLRGDNKFELLFEKDDFVVFKRK